MNTSEYPHTTRLYEQLVLLIEEKIINGDFQVGDQLPTEHEMAAQFRVSRTVIREAMKALKEKGWVETRVGRGTFVVAPGTRGVGASLDVLIRMNPEQAFDYLIEVREIIEPEIAALAAARATPELIAEMRKAVESMESSVAPGGDMNEFLAADSDFHRFLAEASGNPLLITLIKPVVTLMREQQKYHIFKVEGNRLRSQVHHRLIMEAIEAGDAQAARERMRNHINQVAGDIRLYDSQP